MMRFFKYFIFSICFLFGTNPAFSSNESGHHFQRVLIIVLENQNYEDVILDPYFKSLAKRGANLTDFHAITHPSYPNYLAMITGQWIHTPGDFQINLNERTIADLLNAKGLSWKNYAEDYPGNCFTGSQSGLYARKHVPFMSFISIQSSQCPNIVSGVAFTHDVAHHLLPNYMFYSPNMNNDGHDTGLTYASQWLNRFLTPLLNNPKFMQGTLIIVTFDESRHDTTNHIYTVLLSKRIKPGDYNEHYDHFNVLRTVEDNFNLGTLADSDKEAKPISGVWAD